MGNRSNCLKFVNLWLGQKSRCNEGKEKDYIANTVNRVLKLII